MNKKESNFRERFNEALKKSGKTQKMISEETGIPRATISQYLSGKYSAKAKNIGLLAEALDVNPAWLEGGNLTSGRTILIGDKELELLKPYMMTQDQLDDMAEEEFQIIKKKVIKDVEELDGNQIYNLYGRVNSLSTIDDRDWELLRLFNSITIDAKEKILDYAHILNMIPEFLVSKEEAEK